MLTPIAGIIAGTVHVLAGPDHLAAVAPLAAGGHQRGWRVGLSWGLGHATGVLLIGILALLLRDLLPLELISSWSERLVGVALIAIGAWGLHRAMRQRLHAHEHSHDGVRHAHIHFHHHIKEENKNHEHRQPHLHSHLSIGMGILHAFAGSANILGVLPALAIPGFAGALTYLLFFGLGSIATMTIFGTLIQVSLEKLQRSGFNPYRIFLTGTSTAAIAVGGIWLVA